MRNQGIAVEIVQHSLEYVREHHYKVIPKCSFFKGYIKKSKISGSC
ncbi:GNAT family N-acetyltransferase [Coxiella-like endosymbiont]